jgi:hypothetical protein
LNGHLKIVNLLQFNPSIKQYEEWEDIAREIIPETTLISSNPDILEFVWERYGPRGTYLPSILDIKRIDWINKKVLLHIIEKYRMIWKKGILIRKHMIYNPTYLYDEYNYDRDPFSVYNCNLDSWITLFPIMNDTYIPN